MKTKFTTQAEVEAEIDRLIVRGDRESERRDACPFESPEYWRHHDKAVGWYLKAESLMPRSSGRSRYARDTPAG